MSRPPPDPPKRSVPEPPELIAQVGPWRGPTYRYRGARIECTASGFACGLFLDGHPMDGLTFAVDGPITPLVDFFLDLGEPE